jgi:hypothetical protein
VAEGVDVEVATIAPVVVGAAAEVADADGAAEVAGADGADGADVTVGGADDVVEGARPSAVVVTADGSAEAPVAPPA